MKELNFDLGLSEYKVNGNRTVKFNPSDIGFLETLYGLAAKIASIGGEMDKKRTKTNEPGALFDRYKSCERKMRAAMDSVFGEGFCADVFQNISLMSMTNGLFVVESFVYTIIDEMNDDVKDNLDKRNDRIAKYTAKYKDWKGSKSNAVPVE